MTFRLAALLGAMLVPGASVAQLTGSAEPMGAIMIDELKFIDRYDTATVFMTDGAADEQVEESFRLFAERIGARNAATRVDARNYSRYADTLNALRCRPVSRELPAVLFVSKQTRFCQVFRLGDPAALHDVLLAVERDTACANGLGKERVRIEMRAGLNELARTNTVTSALLKPASALLDWIRSRLPRRCVPR